MKPCRSIKHFIRDVRRGLSGQQQGTRPKRIKAFGAKTARRQRGRR